MSSIAELQSTTVLPWIGFGSRIALDGLRWRGVSGAPRFDGVSTPVDQELFIGVDGGGTSCRARIRDASGTLRGEGSGGPANVRLDAALVMDSILTASRAAARAAGLAEGDLSRAHAGLGLAGAGLKSACQALLLQPSPFASIAIETDAYAAWLGAHQGADGAILILGTGSCGLAVVGGRQHYVSGWGAEVSDEASGMWIGREAIRRTLWAHDGRAAGSPLSASILAHFGDSPEGIVAFATTARPADYGRLVPLIMEHAARRDPLALEVLSQAALDAGRLITRLLDVGAPSVCLLGGVAEPLSAWLPPPLKERLAPPIADAMDGAILMARMAQRPRRPAPREAGELLAEHSLMLREAAEAPHAVARLLAENAALCRALGERLRAAPPPFAVSCARGSSDNAATYAKYLLEIRLGLVTASVGPSVRSVYAAAPNMQRALFFAISQSGRSPDLLHLAEAARAGGATTLALVNDTASPLAEICEVTLALHAGPERSVAATKSWICSLAAILQLVAEWAEDAQLIAAVASLPDALSVAAAQDWGAAAPLLAATRNVFVVGRGIGLALAQEAALKLKETCGIHAEALSAAELMHGPLTLAGPDFPVLVFSQHDEAYQSVADLIATLAARDVPVIAAGPTPGGGCLALPCDPSLNPFVTPIASIQSFYPLVERVARMRGRDPDAPPHLKKVTETV